MRYHRRVSFFSLILFSGAALLFGLSSAEKSPDRTRDLTLLFTNDIHGVYKSYPFHQKDTLRMVGGMEALSHYVGKIRAVEPEALLVDCGDVMTGSLAAQLEYQGARGGYMVEFLNRLNYSLGVPGNHAFDLGRMNAEALMGLYRCPVVLSNLIDIQSGNPIALPLQVLKTKGIRVGFTAVMEESFPLEVDPDCISGLKVLPIKSTLKRYLPVLRKRADVIVVIVHAKQRTGRAVAREFPEVDAVLVSSEEGLFHTVKGTPVKSTLGHLRTLGYLKLKIRGKRIRRVEEDLIWLWADKELKPQPEISALVKELEENIGKDYTRILGEADCTMKKKPGKVESPIGRWITDVMRWKTGAEIGFHNSGGIRAGIECGPVTAQDIIQVSPFENTLVTFKLTGKQLKTLLENDITRGHDRIQISGMNYSYFPGKQPGSRIWRIEACGRRVADKGKLLLPEAVFSAVSNDYLVDQAAAKFFGFEPAEIHDTGLSLKKTLCEWLEIFEVIPCSTENRIIPLK